MYRTRRKKSPIAKLAGLGVAAAAVIAAFLVIPNIIQSDSSALSDVTGGSSSDGGYASGDE